MPKPGSPFLLAAAGQLITNADKNANQSPILDPVCFAAHITTQRRQSSDLAQIRDRRLYRDRMNNSVTFVSPPSHLRLTSVPERRRDGRPARVGRERRRKCPEVRGLFCTSFKGASPAGVGAHPEAVSVDCRWLCYSPYSPQVSFVP